MMDVEQILLAGITTVTGALVFVCKLLWTEVQDCKRDRLDLRQEVENVKTHNGELRGYLEALGACDVKDCKFAHPARHQEGSKWGASMLKNKSQSPDK